MTRKKHNIDGEFTIRQHEDVEEWVDKPALSLLRRSLFVLNNPGAYVLRLRTSAGTPSLSGFTGTETNSAELTPDEELGFLTEHLPGTVLAFENGDILAQE